MDRTFQQNPKVEAAPLNEEAILFNPTTTKFFMLNRTSSFIWECLSTPASAETLAGAMCDAFKNVTPSDALSDVQAMLGQMLSMELVIANHTA